MQLIRAGFNRHVGEETPEAPEFGIKRISGHTDFTHHFDVWSDLGNSSVDEPFVCRCSIDEHFCTSVYRAVHGVAVCAGKVLNERRNVALSSGVDQRQFLSQLRLKTGCVADRSHVDEWRLGRHANGLGDISDR